MSTPFPIGSDQSLRDKTYLQRFDRTERVVHWATAALMLICIATALALYVPAVTALVGRRVLVLDIHVYTGLCLPIPVLAGVARTRWGAQLRSDLNRVNRWNAGDRRWLATWGRDPGLEPGKFNGGQKANTAFVGGAIVVMVMTGTVMKWFGPWPLSWRTGATFVHDVLALVITLVVAGHIGYALRYPPTLRAMITGLVDLDWARRHTPAWVAEIEGPPGAEATAPAGPPPPAGPPSKVLALKPRSEVAEH